MTINGSNCINGKMQTPTITPSNNVRDWMAWRFR